MVVLFFIAAPGLSLVLASKDYYVSSWCMDLLCDFSCCETWAVEHSGSEIVAHGLSCPVTWNLPGSGIEPISPPLVGKFLNTGPPGKSHNSLWSTCLVGDDNMLFWSITEHMMKESQLEWKTQGKKKGKISWQGYESLEWWIPSPSLNCILIFLFVVVVESLSHVQLFVTPWTAARQASLSYTISPSLLKFMSIKLVMLSNHFVLCQPLLLLHSIFPSIRVFSNESALWIRWPEYWSFSNSPSNEYSGLISLGLIGLISL